MKESGKVTFSGDGKALTYDTGRQTYTLYKGKVYPVQEAHKRKGASPTKITNWFPGGPDGLPVLSLDNGTRTQVCQLRSFVNRYIVPTVKNEKPQKKEKDNIAELLHQFSKMMEANAAKIAEVEKTLNEFMEKFK